MRAGLTPNAVQWCRCGGLRGPNLAECVVVRRRLRAKVGVFWQSLVNDVDSAIRAFEAQSRGLHALCVRFAAGVAPGPRNTRFRLVASLDRSGLSPAGSHRGFPPCLSVYMASSPHQALPGAITTHPCYQRHVRPERSEWPPAGCSPDSPWTADSLRCGNRLRRTFGCGSILRLSA